MLYNHIPGWCPSKTWSVLVHEDSLLKLVKIWRSSMEEASLKKQPIFVFFALLNSCKIQLIQNTNNINHIKQPQSIPSPYRLTPQNHRGIQQHKNTIWAGISGMLEQVPWPSFQTELFLETPHRWHELLLKQALLRMFFGTGWLNPNPFRIASLYIYHGLGYGTIKQRN